MSVRPGAEHAAVPDGGGKRTVQFLQADLSGFSYVACAVGYVAVPARGGWHADWS